MGDRDDLFNRRIETLEQRLQKLEMFSNVLTSTQRLTTFTSTGGIGTILGLLPSSATFAGSSYGLMLRSSTGGVVRGDTLAFGLQPGFTSVDVTVASTSFSTQTNGPAVTVRVGPSKRILVTFGAMAGVGKLQAAFMKFKVSGASVIGSSVFPVAQLDLLGFSSGSMTGGLSFSMVVTSTMGLSSGSNTLTAVYRKLNAAQASPDFFNRFLVAQPF